jgi:hypothetical protein
MKHFPPGYSFKIKDCSKRSDGEWRILGLNFEDT